MDAEKIRKLIAWRLKFIAENIQSQDCTVDLHEKITELEALLDRHRKKQPPSPEELEEWFELE